MKKLNGRNSEMLTLENVYNSVNSSFVVIYGRRIVGKTTLISEFLKNKDNHLYFLATEESELHNINNFKDMVDDLIENELIKSADLDWVSIFDLITKYKPKEKIVVIDEFQHIGKSVKAFHQLFIRHGIPL